MVEMALLTPLLALILVGAIDLGRVYIDSTRLNNAIKEAAASGLYQPNYLAIKRRAFREVIDPGRDGGSTADDRNLLGTPDVDFVIYGFNRYLYTDTNFSSPIDCRGNPVEITVPACANPGPGDVIEVKGVYYFKPITSMIIRIFPSNIPVRRTVKAVY
jgi:hypothetical protein